MRGLVDEKRAMSWSWLVERSSFSANLRSCLSSRGFLKRQAIRYRVFFKATFWLAGMELSRD